MGPGVYELRNRATGELVLIGSAKNCCYRLSSLLPAPWGQGTRRNSKKRDYVFKTIADIEYRYQHCSSDVEARVVERKRLKEADYVFKT